MLKQNQLAPLINFLDSLDETLTNNRHIKKKFNKNLAIGIKGSKNVSSDYLNSIASHINDETKKDQTLKWISHNKKTNPNESAWPVVKDKDALFLNLSKNIVCCSTTKTSLR